MISNKLNCFIKQAGLFNDHPTHVRVLTMEIVGKKRRRTRREWRLSADGWNDQHGGSLPEKDRIDGTKDRFGGSNQPGSIEENDRGF